jgi:Uma2 family endonuclease
MSTADESEERPAGPPLTIRMPSGGYTVEDLLAMPESHYRIELTDGVLTVSPSPLHEHQYLAAMLMAGLAQARTGGYRVSQAVDVELNDRTTRIPDVLIVRPGARLVRPVDGDDVVVAIEIESPTSGRVDRRLKPSVYADSKISYYWRIELEPEPIAIIHRLENGAYVEVSRGSRIDVTEPFPFVADLADLVDPED